MRRTCVAGSCCWASEGTSQSVKQLITMRPYIGGTGGAVAVTVATAAHGDWTADNDGREDIRESSYQSQRQHRKQQKSNEEDGSTSTRSTSTTMTPTISTPPRDQEHQHEQQEEVDEEDENNHTPIAISDYGNRSGLGIVGDTVDFGCTTTTTNATMYGAYNNINAATMSDPSNQKYMSDIIDNRTLTYVPIRLMCGNAVLCSPQTLASCPMVLRSLQVDITECLKVLPKSVHNLVQRTPIWVNASYMYGDKRDPYILHHSTTHHSPTWLTEIANDIPNKARSVEIYNCFEYERMRYHWNGCGLLLHELCHIIHQHCVDDGLENKFIDELFQKADRSGLYECVLRRDWAGRRIKRDDHHNPLNQSVITSSSRSRSSVISSSSLSSSSSDNYHTKSHSVTTVPAAALEQALTEMDGGGDGDANDEESTGLVLADSDLAYAMVDKKEFFAEMSVTFLANSYHVLDKGDSSCMEECCPPILEPNVLNRVVEELQQYEQQQSQQQQEQQCNLEALYRDSSDDITDNKNKTFGAAANHTRISDDINFSCLSGFFRECQRLIEWTDTGRHRLLFVQLAEEQSSSSSSLLYADTAVTASRAAAVVVDSMGDSNEGRQSRRPRSRSSSLMIDLPFQDYAIRQNCANIKHCNKFYPFTRGQLRFYHKELHDDIESIWKQISKWVDPQLRR